VFRTALRWVLRILLVVIAALVLVQLWFAAHVAYWVRNDPSSTSFMRGRMAILHAVDSRAELRHRWVPYRRISVHLKRSVLAAEDAKFLAHRGFDWDGIRNAYERNMRKGDIVAGGSTITQQLAKNLFFSGQRTWWRKAQEAVITIMLEAMMSKRRIFEIYLNVIEWGEGVFGAAAAARYHFGTSAAVLSPSQAARLAAMVPSPRRYGPGANTAYLRKRTYIIATRARMVRVPN
jgi:monofunctional glycosyltransferase